MPYHPGDETRIAGVGEASLHERKLRVLVGIASYGTGHLHLLEQMIQTYQRMAMEVHVVVFSEAAKGLGTEVEEIVGLPSRNPWTLPFAHKPVFAQRVEQYDLFIYTEDDIGISERQIRAFLKATSELQPDEIAGFLRYEVDKTGTWVLTEPWGRYHWKPDSVRRRGSYTVAEFTNEHAGFYMLNRAQLRRAIASGGFLRRPYRGRYGWPETAATDPYTGCGFRKVICISALRDFLVHHMPNRYAEVLPVSLAAFEEQIETLVRIRDGFHPAKALCAVESERWPSWWQKSYYEAPSRELLEMIPHDAKSILSVGCGWGLTEAELQRRGAKVTAVPLDSIIGAMAERRGVKVVYGTWDECTKHLEGQRFDCVFVKDLLHLQRDPDQMVEQLSGLVAPGGALVCAGPNFDRAPWRLKRALGIDGFDKLRSFESGGFSVCVPRTLARPIEKAGLSIHEVRWLNHDLNQRRLHGIRVRLGSLTAREWILQARR
jgi:2-polyprenyl-3-methyl-5-hydroxy-6-metoxy-1,4-benzoquinol methylase